MLCLSLLVVYTWGRNAFSWRNKRWASTFCDFRLMGRDTSGVCFVCRICWFFSFQAHSRHVFAISIGVGGAIHRFWLCCVLKSQASWLSWSTWSQHAALSLPLWCSHFTCMGLWGALRGSDGLAPAANWRQGLEIKLCCFKPPRFLVC